MLAEPTAALNFVNTEAATTHRTAQKYKHRPDILCSEQSAIYLASPHDCANFVYDIMYRVCEGYADRVVDLILLSALWWQYLL
jgi:hypothetical protein